MRTRLIPALMLAALATLPTACGSAEEEGMTRAQKRAAQEQRAADAARAEKGLNEQMEAYPSEDP